MTTVETLLSDPDTAGVWNLVPERSTIGFKIRNMWGLIGVKGRFSGLSGDGQITGKGAIFGRLDIQVASLRTGIRRRDAHLLSADLRTTLSIKGVTAPVSLPVGIILLDDGSVRVSAQFEVDRAQFGLGWNRFGMIAKAATASADALFVRAPR